MARYRDKPIKPFIQSLMDQYHCESLAELHRKTQIPFDFLRHIADPERKTNILASHQDAASKIGMSLDEWAEGLRK